MSPASSPVVVLPTYNERENIGRLLPEILKQDPRLRVLVVDDRSPDKTFEVARQIAGDYPGRVLLNLRNTRGRGTAVLDGFRQALQMGATCVFEMDADFSHNPADLPRFLKEIEKADVVIGSRFVPGGRIEERGWFRNFLSWGINNIIRTILGVSVRDASGGYRCYNAKVISKLNLDNFLSHDYSMGSELLYRLKNNGCKIQEIPIVFVNRKEGKSKANFKIAFDYVFTILKVRITS